MPAHHSKAWVHGHTRLDEINSAWVDQWIAQMKRIDKVAPTTIQAKVGALARATDWVNAKGLHDDARARLAIATQWLCTIHKVRCDCRRCVAQRQ